MALLPVRFEYLTGLAQPLFANARLSGSWDAQGRPSSTWSETAMEPFVADDGCPAFRATVQLDDSQIGQAFRWGVYVDAPAQQRAWTMPIEVNDPRSTGALRVLHPARRRPGRALPLHHLPPARGQQAVPQWWGAGGSLRGLGAKRP